MSVEQGPLQSYLEAFTDLDAPFLSYYTFGAGDEPQKRDYSRGEFLLMARRAASVLASHDFESGSCITHFFSRNDPADLAFRLAAVMVGVVPVTINWQADSLDTILYKIRATESRAVLFDEGVDGTILKQLKEQANDVILVPTSALGHADPISLDCAEPPRDEESCKLIIFTSGTTGRPKGVSLPYRAYTCNRQTFESFFGLQAADRLALIAVNPMHHANTTAISDWALRRPGAELHLVERYAGAFWRIPPTVVEKPHFDRVVMPMVSRHFDFLDDLVHDNRLSVDLDRLKKALAAIDILLGSAPVGPTTVERVTSFSGGPPLVRFGATETCLQVMGTPPSMGDAGLIRAFERGWFHESKGYYIGRPHPPFTEVQVVQSIRKEDANFFEPSGEGVPGYIVARGNNLMSGYVHDPKSTEAVFHEGWYLGLRDFGYYLNSEMDAGFDFYWMSRDSAMLIRGGANYAYAQINEALSSWLASRYRLKLNEFELAVVGLKIASEHEDACCVTLSLKSDRARRLQENLEQEFIREASRAAAKGAKPDFVRFGDIPKNFKGAILHKELEVEFQRFLAGG